MSDYVLSAVLRLKDELTGRTKKARESLNGVKGAAQGAGGGLNTLERGMHRAGSAVNELAGRSDRLKNSLSGIKGDYSPTIRVRDNASGKIGGIRSMLDSISGKIHTVTVNVRQNGGLSGLASKAGGAISGVAGGMMMGTGMQMAGAAGIGFGVYDTVKTYKDFEKQMAAVKAISTSDMGVAEAAGAMEALTRKAREMGAATQFSATEAAKAFEYMGMAGWNTEQMISGIAPVLNLALASGEDLARVSDIVTDAMTALHIDTRGEDAEKNIQHFTDVLAAAATHSNTNVAMMGEAFKYAAAPAGLFADSYENAADLSNDVALALGLMANSGIKASQAGTALRATLTRMGADTIPTANAMKMLGVSITQVGKDGTEQLKPLRSIFDELRAKMKDGISAEGLIDYAEALSGSKTRNKAVLMEFADKLISQGGKLSKKDQMKFGKMLAGEEALSGLLAVMTASDEDYQNLIKELDNSEGTAAKMAATRADTLAGDFDILKSAWEDLQIEFMTGAGSDGLRSFLQGAQEDINKFKSYIADGFDISDVGKIAMDVVVQLKNKFLELDGVGSILAGGALAAALYKITSFSKKAYSGVKGFFTSSGGGKTGLPGGASAVSAMTVHAGTVIIHAASVANAGAGGGVNLSKGGKGAAGAGVSGAAGAAGNAGRAGKLLKSGGKFLKGGGWLAAFGAGIGIYDAYSTNDEAAAEAAYGADAAQESYESKLADGTATEEDRAAVDAAKAYQQETEDYNKSRMGGAVGSGVGSLAGAWAGTEAGAAGGAAIGALFGGVGAAPGAAIGGVLGMIAGGLGGSELGEMLGSGIAENFDGAIESMKSGVDGLKASVSAGWESITASASATWDGIAESAASGWESITANISAGWECAKQSVVNGWSGLASWFDSAVWTPISDAAITKINLVVGIGALGWGLIKPYWEGASEWFDATVWLPIANTAEQTWSNVSTMATNAWTGTCEFFATVPSWLDSTVWQPISDTAEWAWEGIRNTIIGKWKWLCYTWESTSEWFDATVWTPITNTAGWAWSGISSAASEAWGGISGAWGAASSWFDATVWQPVSSAADSVKNSIVSAFDGALSGVKSMWSGAADWFDTNVVSPLREKFDGLIALKNSIADAGAGVTGLITSNGTGHNAIGTSFWGGGWTEVNEHGGEIIDLPQGSRVYPHATTMKMLKDGMGGRTTVPTTAPQVTVTGNTFTVREEADIDRIAYRLYQLMFKSHVNMNGGTLA